ncbi:hypothetical protein CC80DRAFT_447968 [Byssothecium circinans]|uniref:Calcineurin-like phosphoesterase domain-containing protein n=1 Tax=Byssothecium circinans TaxID=147558 RepID=A0A6A5TRA2_9PLEO|nr:hypothetical protein CC80DRAFT_447968 [Byssothecium circinans]
MQFSRFFFCIACVLSPIAFLGTSWLYLYPIFDRACAFPTPPGNVNGKEDKAPFRLLALGDPQLEGDTSLPKPGAPIFPSLAFLHTNVTSLLRAGNYTQAFDVCRAKYWDDGGWKGWGARLGKEGVKYIWGKRKWIDLWGNDWYLAHIVRTLRWWTGPSHVVVLGDLLGSQWIGDEEFERRSKRYWEVVVKGMERVPDYIMTGEDVGMDGSEGIVEGIVEGKKENGAKERAEGVVEAWSDEQGEQEVQEKPKKWGGTREVLGTDKRWESRVINIAGNHDIGYAGDIDEKRIERFERVFGRVNWDIVFTLPNTSTSSSSSSSSSPDGSPPPELRLVILNSMNLDTPAWTPSLQRESYDFMNHIVSTSRPVTDKTHATILLTHIPFHKESGICIDSPFFTFFEGGSGVKEQNMLSKYVSKMLLESIFGLSGNMDAEGGGFGRRGIVINGHDHAGCDVLHWIEQPGVKSRCPEDVLSSMELEQVNLQGVTVNASEASTFVSAATNETEADTQFAAQELQPSDPEDSEDPRFQTIRYPHPPYTVSNTSAPTLSSCLSLNHVPRLREITIRSMMGDYAGYAGFLSAWFDPTLGEQGEWNMEFSTCGMGTQHWWWVFHVVDLIFVTALVSGGVAVVVERNLTEVGENRKAVKEEEKAQNDSAMNNGEE